MSLFKKEKKELVIRKEVLPPVTEQTVTDYMKAFGLAGNLMDHEVEAFKQMAVMHNLNPFNREIYCVAYGQGDKRKLSILTGYEVYIKKAEQSGLLEYWTVEEASPEIPIEQYWAKIIIKRSDRAKEQTWTTHYSEGVQKDRYGKVNSFWQKQPRLMTKKTAMSQGFRLFFEDVMHGIPYTREEMPEDKGGMTDVTPQPKAIDKSEPKKEPDMPEAKIIKKVYEESKEKVKEDNKTIGIKDGKVLSYVEDLIKEKDKGIERNYDRSDPILPEKPKDKPQKQESPSQGNFSQIIALVNGQGIPNEDKIKILSAARACNKNEEELAIVLKNVKNEYSL